MTHEYVVIIRKTTDEQERKRIIDDVTYKGFALVKIEEGPNGLQLARFRMPDAPDGA